MVNTLQKLTIEEMDKVNGGGLHHVGGAIVGAVGGMAAYGISNIFSPGGISGCGFAGAAVGGAITGATFGAYGGAYCGAVTG